MNHIRFIGLKNFPDRLLEAANNLGSHLTNIFDDAFLKVLSPAPEAGSHTGPDTQVVAPVQLRSRKTRTVEPLPDYRIYVASFVASSPARKLLRHPAIERP